MSANVNEFRLSPALLGIVYNLINNAHKLTISMYTYASSKYTAGMRDRVFDTIHFGTHLESYEQVMNVLEYVKRILDDWNLRQADMVMYSRRPVPVPEGVKTQLMKFDKFISDPRKVLTTYFTEKQRAEIRANPDKYLEITEDQLAKLRGKSREVLDLANKDVNSIIPTLTYKAWERRKAALMAFSKAQEAENMEGGARRRRRTHKNSKHKRLA